MQLTERRATRTATSRVLPRVLLVALFAALIVAAAALRVQDLNWDQFQHIHPDERFIVWVADTMRWTSPPAPSPAAAGEGGALPAAAGEGGTALLNPQTSPFNPFMWPATSGDLAGKPRNYAYGHFPLYLLVVLAHLAAAVGRWFGETTMAFPSWMQPFNTIGRHLAEYNYLALVGRAISALADLGTLGIVYAMGVRVGRRCVHLTGCATSSPGNLSGVGLIAAGFYAFAVLPIQLSHFAAVDALLTFFVAATVALAARYAEQGGRWTWALAGVTAGMAVGSKFSAVLLALPLIAAACFRLPGGTWADKALAVLRRVVPVGLVAFVTFAITNPFALIELGQYVYQISAQNEMVSGRMDAPYTRQYIGALPYWYFVQQLSQWGIGWPAGIVAWAGLVWALVRFGLGKASAAMTVLLAWAFPYFVVTGLFHTKFLRYMAPLLPFLLVFGAAAAVAAYRWLGARWGRVGRAAWGGLAVVAAAVTVLWAIAFSGVYQQEHPWLAASKWMYQNAPEGSKILSEAWDDALPLTLDELTDRPPLRKYERAELPMWDDDTPAKVERLSTELADADYIAIASNRISAPVSRLAGRYPMTAAYYRQLFTGELGYQMVADFSAYPRLGGWVIRDDHADESLSVYDHPHAYVFRNVGRLTKEEIGGRLRGYLAGRQPQVFVDILGGLVGDDRPDMNVRAKKLRSMNGAYAAVSVYPSPIDGALLVSPAIDRRAVVADARTRTHKVPGLASIRAQEPTPARPLMLDQPVSTLPDVTDYRWNAVASASPILAVVLWWLVITLFGWFAWPLLFPLTRGLADRGHGIARIFGWLLLGWVHWMGVSLGLWQNGLKPLLLILLALVLIGRVAWTRQRRAMAEYMVRGLRLILAQEALFAGAFLAFVLIRMLNPDLWQPWNGGEKFMEFAFLNATLRSPVFPPYDPYFAGGTINYYYFGLYLVGLPIRLTGIFAEVAFNLAVPSLFALTALGVFSVAYSIAKRRDEGASAPLTPSPRPGVVGALAVVLTLLAGNLTGLEWVFGALAQFFSGKGMPAFDYWAASRVIPFTINEFPLWTFTFADLHPHLIAMPFGMLVAGLSLNWLRRPPQGVGRWLLALLMLALALGALGAINTWDLPTYALLVAGALIVAAWRLRVPLAQRLAPLGGAAISAVGALLVAVALYLPFYQHYHAQVGGGTGSVVGRFLGVVQGASPLRPWLLIWGLFLFLGLSYTLVELLARRVASDVRAEAAGLSAVAEGEADGIEGNGETAARRGGRFWLFGVLIVVAVLAILAAAGRPTVALAALPLLLALPLIVNRRASSGQAFVGLLLVLGLAVVAGIELVYLRDFLEGGDWYRMNTLFKFSVPASLFLGLAGGYMLARLWSLTERAPLWLGLTWQVGAAVLLAGSLVYLYAGVRERVLDRFPGDRPAIGTLDGMAYMTVGKYTWPGGESVISLASDYDALKWLLANVKGTPVVAEAPAGSYTVNGEHLSYDYYRAGGLRVASMTGLPTFVGQHQYEQRPGEDVAKQTVEGMDFFQTTDLSEARRIMREVGVRYIYVGQLERLLFSPESLRKFDVMAEAGELKIAYRNAGVIIYEAAANSTN